MIIDHTATAELIRRMMNAGIGHRRRWKSIVRKLGTDCSLGAEDARYFSSLARIYQLQVTPRSRIFHIRLSDLGARPPCCSCGSDSEFYCNMNDAYYCTIHIVGHDENEQ